MNTQTLLIWKPIITEHPKTSDELYKAIRQAEKLVSISSLKETKKKKR